jgi:hypothetical protein
MSSNNIYNQIITLQRVPNGGFSYVNSSQGITLSSGQQFFIDSVSTGFFPPIPPTSTDKDKYRKQKWLSVGLEGNSFRRYINENSGLKGIPSGLEPGNFVYFTIEPKSSFLESGVNTTPKNARYISSLRAKPYMVIENDAKRENSYEKTPASLFTGVSGNNNFVVFHPQSQYKNLALQSMRFHPIIGNGYLQYDLWSGRAIYIQPKNHHIKTFTEINVKSGSSLAYGQVADRYMPMPQNVYFPSIASGRALLVENAIDAEANGIYVGKERRLNPTYFINQNNYRIYNSGLTDFTLTNEVGNWTLIKPTDSTVSFTISNNSVNFTNLYKTSGASAFAPYTFSQYLSQPPVLSNPSVGWHKINNVAENIRVTKLGAHGTNIYDSLVYLNKSNEVGGRGTTGSYIMPKFGSVSLDTVKINGYKYFTTVLKASATSNVPYNTSANSLTGLRFFSPAIIFDNQGLSYFPYTNSQVLQNQLFLKDKIFFKRPLSSNLHQSKEIELKIKFQQDDRMLQPQKVIKNYSPVQEMTYNTTSRIVELYDEKDNEAFSDTPFTTISGQDYSFEQTENFIYKSRPDFNNATKQNVIRY